jgi:hypothetical protein
MEILRTFTSAKEAREYRHEHGTGGWIFDDDNGSGAILFPPSMPPSHIFHHPITRGRSGQLIGAG